MKAFIKKASPQIAAGSSGERYSHLQATLCDELVEDHAAFTTLIVSSRILPHVFLILHKSPNPSAVTSSGDLLATFSAAGATGNWQTTSSPGANTA